MIPIKNFVTVLLLVATSSLIVPVLAQETPTNTIRFSGYEWEVREQGLSGPGPNHWNPKNVWVDKSGSLHLKISRIKTAKGYEWHCAEIYSKKKFGFGQYEFQTIGRVDQLDRNVVLGLFDYHVYGEDPFETNEIDIEFARWGNGTYPNGNFTVYPASGARDKNATFTFEYSLPANTPGMLATHRFTRDKSKVTLATFAGAGKPGDKSIAQWTYAPTEERLIPKKPLAIHLNLWLFDGKAPADGKEVEVVIKKFAFTPAP